MNLYETIIIFKPTKHEESKVFKLMMQHYSKTYKCKCEDIGVKKLAYEVSGFPEGYYNLFTWAGTPDDVVELESRMREAENILKFMTVKKEGYPEDELDAYDPAEDAKSEQPESGYNPNTQVDALDVLLGFFRGYYNFEEKLIDTYKELIILE